MERINTFALEGDDMVCRPQATRHKISHWLINSSDTRMHVLDVTTVVPLCPET